jgi:hypothetical protein
MQVMIVILRVIGQPVLNCPCDFEQRFAPRFRSRRRLFFQKLVQFQIDLPQLFSIQLHQLLNYLLCAHFIIRFYKNRASCTAASQTGPKGFLGQRLDHAALKRLITANSLR